MEVTVDASLTGGHELALEVTSGTPLAKILDTAGVLATQVWCGSHALALEHPAGTYPLLHGARLRSAEGEPTALPQGPHVVAVAGPDCAAVRTLDTPRLWGRNEADVTIADPAMSRAHATVSPHPHGAHVRDAGSTNGYQLWTRERPVRGTVLTSDRVARLGDTWIEVRGVVEPPTSGEAEPSTRLRGRATAMVGAGASSLVLAIVTGRWYLALIAMVFPLIALAPILAARVRPPRPHPLAPLPDPTRSTDESDASEATIAITGNPGARDALARAIILHRGRRPPSHAQSLDEPWMRWLPEALPHDGHIVFADAVPSWCDTEYRATGRGTVVVKRGQTEHDAPPLGVSQARADAAARRIAGAQAGSNLPHEVRWADVAGRAHSTSDATRSFVIPVGLRTTPGSGNGAQLEPWLLDLDADGPHFLVAGTTGSGKSALLETLVLAACHAHAPSALNLALVDFKGGAGLASCMTLPHVAGKVTDLDGREARRALAALADEVAHRKSQLHQAHHSSFKEWVAAGGAPPRLLVVVDEFQEIGLLHREFMPDLTRIAAQGRSLGMHVVLATQRPAGAVTPEIRANTATTIALRVASDSESRDLVGTADAALIDPRRPGRAIVAHGAERVEVQVALPIATRTPQVRRLPLDDDESVTSLADLVRERWRGATPAQPLWHPTLPEAVDLHHLIANDLSGGSAGVVLGVEDWPRARRREILRWDIASGPMLVVGPPSPSRTQIMAAAAESALTSGIESVWLPMDPREAARTVWLAQHRKDVLLVVPDLTLALQTLATSDRGAPAEALLNRASAGMPLVMGLGAGSHHRIASTAAMKVVMTGLSEQDDAMWSVPKELSDIGSSASAVRVWTSAGWREARVALTAPTRGTVLVAPLPRSLCRDDAGARGRDERTPLVLGVGGDEGRDMLIDPAREVLVVGPPGDVRDWLVETVNAAGSRVAALDSPVLIPPAARAGLILVLEPTSRTVEDLCKGSGYGLVDPTPGPGRVLWVDRGQGECVQLVSHEGGAEYGAQSRLRLVS